MPVFGSPHQPRRKLVAQISLAECRSQSAPSPASAIPRRPHSAIRAAPASSRCPPPSPSAGHRLPDQPRKRRRLLAIEIRLQPMPHRLMQQHPRPSRPQHHFHLARRSRHRAQLQNRCPRRLRAPGAPGSSSPQRCSSSTRPPPPRDALAYVVAPSFAITNTFSRQAAAYRWQTCHPKRQSESAAAPRYSSPAPAQCADRRPAPRGRPAESAPAAPPDPDRIRPAEPDTDPASCVSVNPCTVCFAGPVAISAAVRAACSSRSADKIVRVGIAGALAATARACRSPRSLPGWPTSRSAHPRPATSTSPTQSKDPHSRRRPTAPRPGSAPATASVSPNLE